MTPLSIFGARSFWALVLSIVAQFVPWISEADVEAMSGHAVSVVSALAAAWSLWERRHPKRRLVVRGPVR